MKRKTKALDFHFLWHVFEEIQNIRKSLIEKSKQDSEFVKIDEKVNLQQYNDKLKIIWNELQEWVNSNIPVEDVDKLLEELFENKGKVLTQKLKLITKVRTGKNANQ